MFGHAPFLGQVRLVDHPGYVDLGQRSSGMLKSKREQCLQFGGAKLLECSNDPTSLQCRTLTATHDSCLAELYALERQEPSIQPAYPIKYPEPPTPWIPVPTPVETPRTPMRPANMPEYGNITPSTPGAQQAQGLPCPPGQYRPQGSGWCVPVPVESRDQAAPSRFSMSPFGGLFTGGGGMTYSGT